MMYSYIISWVVSSLCGSYFCCVMLNFAGLLSQYDLNTVKPQFTNTSDQEQFGLRTRRPSTSWSDKLGVSASAVFVEEWSSGKYPESAWPCYLLWNVACGKFSVHVSSQRQIICFRIINVWIIKFYVIFQFYSNSLQHKSRHSSKTTLANKYAQVYIQKKSKTVEFLKN
jgi:hypothetical protein